MDEKNVVKFTSIVNTSILGMVLGLMFFFYMCKAEFLVYFSIPTIFVYIIGYVLIAKKLLYFYVNLVYFWITLYMSIATACLGYQYGFHLYSLSMILIIYYSNYIAYKIGTKRVASGFTSLIIIICYLGSTVYVSLNGPVYEGSKTSAAVFWISNSVIVFWFLIFYTKTLIKTTIESEEKLKEMSYVDRLTGLYNRHFMVEKLNKAMTMNDPGTVAMIDIDDFKKVNDNYGHNAGDYVLQKISKLMNEKCSGCTISRWGGEEFLLLIEGSVDAPDMMERLRKAIVDTDFEFENKKIDVSVTIGIAEKQEGSVDKWIQTADNKLYIGKKNGKNVVIL